MNALEHCGSLGNSRVVSFWEKKKIFISGGHVVVPKTEKQNLDVVAIAEQYYKVSVLLYPSLCWNDAEILTKSQ